MAKKKPKWLKWLLEFLDKLSPTEWFVAGAFLISIISSFWSPVRAILTYAIDVAILPLLIFTLAPLVIALSLSIRRRPSAERQFRAIDIVTSGLPIQLLWRLKMPVEQWVDIDMDTTASSYWMSILDGPVCGNSTGADKYCRNRVSKPPSREFSRDSWRVYFRCGICQAGMDDHEMRDRYMEQENIKKEVIEALQRYVRNGGQIRDKMVLSVLE